MDVGRLSLLRELAARGSVTAVAQATHRTASAVSQQLKVLEREVGASLVEPAGRGIQLTAAGRMLAGVAEDAVVALERVEAAWEEYAANPMGVVTLATFPTAGQMLLPGMLRDAAAMPGLEVVCTDLDPPVIEFAELALDYDIVVGYTLSGSHHWTERGLVAVPLMEEPLDVALPDTHRLAERATLRAADLVDETWIGVPEGFPFDYVLAEIAERAGRTLRVAQRFSSTRVTETVVAAGLGIALLPRFTSGAPGIVLRPLVGLDTSRHIYALFRRDRAERLSVRAVVRMLQTHAEHVAASVAV